MQVKPYSVWFQDIDKFEQWQTLKKSGDAKAFAAFQEKTLRARDARQFINPQPVKILKVELEKNRVSVEMTGAGRLQGTEWLLDVEALMH